MIPLSIIMAIAAVESGGNARAVGRNGELGILQISKAVVDDCNRFQKTVHFVHEDALHPLRAEAMFRIYVGHYAERLFGDDQDAYNIACLWHYGPSGLGISQGAERDYPRRVANMADYYERHKFDTITDKHWESMFARERAGLNANPIWPQIHAALAK